MQLLGITGGVGMGKSVTANFLRERGVALIDTDDLARDLVRPGKPALAAIVQRFGPEMINQAGELRRGQLAATVFADPAARTDLESILHPPIREAWLFQVEQWRKAGIERAAVVIPLLFETQAQTSFTATVCVACSAQTQKTRLLARGWSERAIIQRIDAQWPVRQKMELADFVIWTEGPLEAHRCQVEQILNQ